MLIVAFDPDITSVAVDGCLLVSETGVDENSIVETGNVEKANVSEISSFPS